jgi:hypothetical protein
VAESPPLSDQATCAYARIGGGAGPRYTETCAISRAHEWVSVYFRQQTLEEHYRQAVGRETWLPIAGPGGRVRNLPVEICCSSTSGSRALPPHDELRRSEPLHRQEERRLPYFSTLATKKNELPVRGAGRSISERPPDRDTGCQQAYFATVLIGNVRPPSSAAVRERRMPSLRILCWSVDRLTPRRAAAPFGPEITPFVSSKAHRI